MHNRSNEKNQGALSKDARRQKNNDYAKASRERKKQYELNLQEQIQFYKDANHLFRSDIRSIKKENKQLKQQVASFYPRLIEKKHRLEERTKKINARKEQVLSMLARHRLFGTSIEKMEIAYQETQAAISLTPDSLKC